MPSPVKPAREGPSIMDVEFNEEDDDDEYNPEKDEEVSFHEFICLFHIFLYHLYTHFYSSQSVYVSWFPF